MNKQTVSQSAVISRMIASLYVEKQILIGYVDDTSQPLVLSDSFRDD